MKPEDKFMDSPSIQDLIDEITQEKLRDPKWKAKQDELFVQNLDHLDTLPGPERISILGGIDPNNSERTVLSKKKWADQKAQSDLSREIRDLITADEISSATQRVQELIRRKKYKLFEPAAKGLGISLRKDQQDQLIDAEQIISSFSTSEPVNPKRLRRFLVEAVAGVERLKLFYIKCARFAFPKGQVSIIPTLDDFRYVDINGKEKFRPASNETGWMDNTRKLSRQLRDAGIENDIQIAVADTDIADVRALPRTGPQAKNVKTYTEKLQEKNPDLDITSFSDLEKNLDLEAHYRGFYSNSLVFLLTDGTNNPNAIREQRQNLVRYGYTDKAIDLLISGCEKNQRENFSLPISPQTVGTIVLEEQESQSPVIGEVSSAPPFMKIYSCARIARDLTQFGVIMPALGKNVAYVSDRQLKAVDLGFTANKQLGQEKQVVIFQNYDKD